MKEKNNDYCSVSHSKPKGKENKKEKEKELEKEKEKLKKKAKEKEKKIEVINYDVKQQYPPSIRLMVMYTVVNYFFC